MIATPDRESAPKNRPSRGDPPPPLENGDHLTAKEFFRRYEAMPLIKKAELIDGIVHMASPVRADMHAVPDAMIHGWLSNYVMLTPGVEHLCNATVKFDVDNVAQPDGALRIIESAGGQSRIEEGYVWGAPEMIVEIAASSVSIDLHDKLRAYRRNRAREYLVWRTWDAQLDWFVLKDGEFERLQPDAAGIYRSEVFPGLALDSLALLRGDRAAVWDTLRKALASSEHAAFVERLTAKKS